MKTSLWKNFVLKTILLGEKDRLRVLLRNLVDYLEPPHQLKPLRYLAKLNKRHHFSVHLLQVSNSNQTNLPLISTVIMFTSQGQGIGGQTGLFGQPQQQQAQPLGFGAKPLGFGQPTTSTPSAFGFGQPAPQQQQTSLFGAAQQPKPFGGTTFGAPTTSQPASAFGTQVSTASFGFGAQQVRFSSLHIKDRFLNLF